VRNSDPRIAGRRFDAGPGGRGGRRAPDRAIKKLGNRVVAGLVLAALIVGAIADGASRDPGDHPRLPRPREFVFFVVAGLMGMWLVITILRNDS
jgi:hypothetical protein